MAEAEHDPDFDMDDPAHAAGSQQKTPDEGNNEAAQAQQKPKKKKKRRAKQEDVENQAAMGAVAATDQPTGADGLPSIFAAAPSMPPISSGRGEGGNQPIVEDDENLEISDSEAPDIDQAKKNLRKQQQKQRKGKKQKTVVQGVQDDMQVEAPVTQSEMAANAMKQQSARAAETDKGGLQNVQRPGLGGDDAAPESEAEDSGVIENNNNEKLTPGMEEKKGVGSARSGGQFEEQKLPQITAMPPSQIQNVDSEHMARQLQAQYDAEAVVEDEDEDEEDGGRVGGRRNRRGKKGRRRRREDGGMAGQTMGLSDMDFRDNQDIELMSQDFSIEHFRKLIKKTFDDYYPLEYNKSTFNMDEYLSVVDKMQLVANYSNLLEMNDQNILTLRNMPWLDLGELPVSYNTHKTEAFQVYLIPQDELPSNMIVTYNNWKRCFESRKVMKVYEKTKLQEKGIALEDITETLNKASELIEPYRGQLAFRNKIIKLALGIAAVCDLIIAISIGMSMGGNYWAPMLVVVIYLLIFFIVVTIFKYRSSYQMRMSQFLLSVFCRVENNRLYLKHGVEVRPGFTGKWIEFACLENNVVDEIIQMMRQRFLKPCLEQKAAIFDKEVMGQHGLIAEQQDIENQIMLQQNERDGQRDEDERAEVARAAVESNPNDFSEEQDMSIQAMQANVNSQAAMAQYQNQPAGLPPSVIAGGQDVAKKSKKGRRKKNNDDPNQYAQPS